jgi:hypothetical protein
VAAVPTAASASTATWVFFIFTLQGIEKTALARCKFSVLFEDGAFCYTGQDDVAYTLFV